MLNNRTVSRNHALIDYKDGVFYVIDRNSTNGVFVNGKKVMQEKLKDGDLLRFGDVELYFRLNRG